MKNLRQQKRGITMIEVLISIAIIGILAGLTWTSVSNARKQTLVSSSCESVSTLANKARSYALGGINGVYRVSFSCNPTNDTCEIKKSTVATGSATSFTSMSPAEIVTLPKGVNVTMSGAKIYTLPYGTSSGTVTGTVSLQSSPSFSRSLSIDNFKATCQ